jgi:hypothetical protein
MGSNTPKTNRIDNLTAAEFGLTARHKHVQTPEQKLAAAAKAKATREARHNTMGSKQKVLPDVGISRR